MKLFNKIRKALGLSLLVVVMSLVFFGGRANAQSDPYGPLFNYFTDAPNIGDEHDFLRVQKTDGTRVNSLEQCEGDVTMWFYVHNSQAAINNGTDYTGRGVAKDTRLRVQMPTGENKSQELKAFVSASNADTVQDNAFITCGGSAISLDFVSVDPLYTTAPEGYTLTGDIASAQGAALALNGKSGGLMPGCWDHRVRVTFKVRIKKKVVVPPSSAVCVIDDKSFKVDKDRRVTLTLDAQLQNATKTGKYEINWGDGSAVSTKQTDSHTYTKDGEYTIRGRVEVKLNDTGKTVWIDGGSCIRKVIFEAGKPPVVPPVTPPTTTVVTPPANGKLTDTGAGDMFGIFTGVSAASAAVHQVVTRRRARA